MIFVSIMHSTTVLSWASDGSSGISTIDLAPELSVISDKLTVGGYGPEMVVVPLGGPNLDHCVAEKGCDETITDIVRSMISSPYAISKYEITFDQFDMYIEASEREFKEDNGWGRGSRPVIFVAWKDALGYVDWLSNQTGFKYRLPSVIEWEHAARAGTHTAYWWGKELGANRANCSDCGSKWSQRKTAPVGSFPPNPWGIFDMHGNVSEFTQDCAMKKRRFSLSKRFSRHLNVLSAEPKFFKDCSWARVQGSSWMSTHVPLTLWKSDDKNAYIPEQFVAYPERYTSAAKGIRVVRELKSSS